MLPKPRIFIFQFLIIAVLNGLAYCPSLLDPPRSDQIIYLGNTADQKNFGSLAFHNFDYNRTHQKYGNPWDEALFRPVFYFILGSQRWAFGYDFMTWQVFTFFLHLVVSGLLLKLLLNLCQSPVAFFAVAFFSLIPANNDMVTWHHINGYLIALACLLWVLNKIFSQENDKPIPWPTILVVVCLMTLASLIHETYAVYSLWLGFWIILFRPMSTLRRNIIQGLIACMPTVIFGLWNHIDLVSKGSRLLIQMSTTLDIQRLLNGLNQSLPATFWWIYTGIFPTQIKIFPYQRTMVLPYYAFAHNGLFDLSLFGLLSVTISTSLICIIVYQMIKNKTAGSLWRILLLSSLPMGMLAIFILTVSIGRLSYGDPNLKLAENSNYGYVFWLLFLVTVYRIYALWDRLPPISTVLRKTIYALLTASVVVNLLLTLDVNLRRSHIMGPQKRILSATRDLVREYGKEKNLTFSLTAPAKEALYADWITKTYDPSRQGHVYLQLLYPEQYTDQDPQFVYSTNVGFQRTTTTRTRYKPAPIN